MNLFEKISASLRKTRAVVADGLMQTIGARPKISPELYDDLEEVLLRADVGFETTEHLIESLRTAVREKRVVDSDQVPGLLHEIAVETLRGAVPADPVEEGPPPRVILVCGVNGVGKTTTIGKLAHREIASGKTALIVAADTFRAAACEQLEIWGERAGADVVSSRSGADPASVAFDGVQAGLSRGADVVIVDTAGRLHSKGNLMEELAKIHRVVGRAHAGAPSEVLLVLDATIGQNGLAQAREFLDAAGVTGLVLAKLDGTARGGVVLAIARETGLPVRYVGIGEGIGDLEPFDPEAFADALLGPTDPED